MTLPHPNTDQISLPIVLAVLGDPTRLAIVRYLASKEGVPLNCSRFLDLGSKTNLSYPGQAARGRRHPRRSGRHQPHDHAAPR